MPSKKERLQAAAASAGVTLLLPGEAYFLKGSEVCHVISVSFRVLSLLLVIGNVGNPASIILSLTILKWIE